MRIGSELWLDVRQMVARHEDPFQEIMRTADVLTPGHKLAVVSAFQPRLLYRALVQRGYEYDVERYEEGGWVITIHKSFH